MTKMKALRWGVFLSLFLGALSARAELQVYSGSNVFGLAPTASAADFAMTLGQPTAELPLQGGRRGLLYGNSLMLIFEGDNLREARCWLLPRFTGDLYLGWLQGVPGRAGLEGFVLDDRVRLGMPRHEAESALQGLEGSADQNSAVALKHGQPIWLGFGSADSHAQAEDGEPQVLVSLTVHFDAQPAR